MTKLIDYNSSSKNILPKILFIFLQLLFIYLSYLMLNSKLPGNFYHKLGIAPPAKTVLFPVIFNILIFIFYAPSILMFVKRKILFQEIIGVSLAFGTYYLLYPIIFLYTGHCNYICIASGSLLLLTGLFIHFYSEYQRFRFKKEHPDTLYTGGLWKYSRHINYFSDLLWASGYALGTCSIYAFLVPVLLFIFFYFFNIPQLEKHLATKYQEDFEVYKTKTKMFIPFML